MTRGQRAMHGPLGAAIGCLQAITTLDLRRAAVDRGPARRLRAPAIVRSQCGLRRRRTEAGGIW